MKRFPLRVALLALIGLVAASACSEIETRFTDPNEDEPRFEVYFQIPGGQSGGGSSAASPNFAVVVDDAQGNTLSFNGGQVVVREMQLGRSNGECVDNEDPSEDDGDACAEFTVEPDLLPLPVDQGAFQLTSPFPVGAGTYDRLEFDIHVATQEDQRVINNAPGLVGESVQLQGAFTPAGQEDGSPFSLTLNPAASLSLDFGQTVQAEPGTISRITLVMEMEDLFRREDGTLIDPTQIQDGGPLDERVESQIVDAFSIQLGPPQ